MSNFVETQQEIVYMLDRAVKFPEGIDAQLCRIPDVQKLIASYVCPAMQVPKTPWQERYAKVLKALENCVEWNEEYKKINNLVGDPWCFTAAKQVLGYL